MLIQEDYFKNIFNTVHEGILILDENMRVLSANRSFFNIFKVDSATTIGSLLYDLGNGQWNIPYLRVLLEDIFPKNDTIDDCEIEHNFESIGHKTMLLNACKIREKNNDQPIILLAIEDITERKRLEDLLTESEERYRRIFETASDGIVLLEKREGNIINANPATEKMLGYSKEECIGKNLQDIGVSLDMSDFPSIMQALNRSGIINYDGVHVKTRSGQDIYTDIYLVDRARLAQCNIRDVTERKQSEEALQTSETEFRLLAEAMPQIVWITRPDGWNTYFNHQWVDYTGLTLEESYGHGWNKPFHPDDQKRAWDAWQNATKYGDTYSLECRLRRADGVYKWWLVRGVPVLDDHGAVLKWFGTCTDIDDIKRATDALRESEERFRHIAENTDEWIWEVNKEGLYTYASNVVEKILGYKPEEIVGKKYFYDFFPLDKQEQMKKEAFEVFAIKKAFRKYVNSNVHKNGSIIIMETSGSPILGEGGDLQGYRGVDVNITEYRKLEEQLRHAQKMEAVGTLAGGIAHDFNNILNVIMGYGSIIMDKLEAGSPSKEQMNQVLIAAERAANLTKRLLLFSRKEVAEFKLMDVNEIVINIEKMLSRIIGEDINLVAELMGTKALIMADAGQMEQVLLNLATNARDAMPKGGRLTISTELREIDADFIKAYEYGSPGRYVVISITDTGIGIDKEKQAMIFDPFFTTKEAGKGTGLGLSIAYGIIKQHSGYIKVYSEIGKGTTFKIWLPVIEETAEKKPEAEALSYPKGGTEIILVAEDDASLRKVSRIVLESSGYSVIIAEDGEDAITKFMENRDKIALVVLDMIMPKKSGKEACEAIRRLSPRTKILFASGYTMDIIMTRELTEAGFDFILKPMSPQNFLKKVREILDR